MFLVGALLATVWLLVSTTMKEPPYVSSIRVEIPPEVAADETLAQRLRETAGVSEAIVVADERSAYLKIDTKVTNRVEIEQRMLGA